MNARVLEHLQVLRDQVFQVDKLWPQYKLLLSDLASIALETHAGSTVVSLERTVLYGGFSLFAPLFQEMDFVSIDCSPQSADERGPYNVCLTDDEKFIAIPFDRRASIFETGISNDVADLVLVPNLVHHISDQNALFKELARIVKPGGRVYVFEALVREIHQSPDDFLRYTPFGLEYAFRQVGLEPEALRTEGGPFQVLTYCWTQALQYLGGETKRKYSDWFFSSHFAELMELDRLYTSNLEKQHSSFPMCFSMVALKQLGSELPSV